VKQQTGMLFAWEAEPASALGRWAKRLFSALVFGGLFLLPFFAYLAAEPTPYRDPAGAFSLTPPDGWVTDDSGHMGPGLVAKGPADETGNEPLIHLTHEAAGIVTLEVRWQTLLGQLRYDAERVKFLAIEEHPEATPPYAQAAYSYQRGGRAFLALTRLALAQKRFYQMTAVAPEPQFEQLRPGFLAAFDSLRTGTP
jgi:hypothetical protein